MRILFFGDIVGRSGRTGIMGALRDLKSQLKPDAIVVNGENAAGGFGITEEICRELFSAGVDVISTGNHAFDQRDSLSVYDSERRLLRPANYPAGVPGKTITV